MNVLILGHTGMLGSMVYRFLREQKELDVITTLHRFPYKDKELFVNIDVVVNCIGSIPQKHASFEINYELPKFLLSLKNTLVIHPGTDCELDDDQYGKSKKDASELIVRSKGNTKIIQSSIIGPEQKQKVSLLEWCLRSKGSIQGYTEAKWNGVTTLTWAKFCYKLILNWELYPTKSVIGSDKVSKYELLLIFKEVFDLDIEIEPVQKGVDKSLDLDVNFGGIEAQIKELNQYIDWTFTN